MGNVFGKEKRKSKKKSNKHRTKKPVLDSEEQNLIRRNWQCLKDGIADIGTITFVR